MAKVCELATNEYSNMSKSATHLSNWFPNIDIGNEYLPPPPPNLSMEAPRSSVRQEILYDFICYQIPLHNWVRFTNDLVDLILIC